MNRRGFFAALSAPLLAFLPKRREAKTYTLSYQAPSIVDDGGRVTMTAGSLQWDPEPPPGRYNFGGGLTLEDGVFNLNLNETETDLREYARRSLLRA
jgi:hypothetical protein